MPYSLARNRTPQQGLHACLNETQHIGLGFGPALVPMISDYILRDPTQLRWGLLIVVVFSGTVAAILLWHVRARFREQVAQTAQWQ